MRARCRHCQVVRSMRARRLCAPCYRDPAIRSTYAPLPGGEKCNYQAKPTCWACGVEAPRQTHLAAIGWHLRPHTAGTHRMNETYCHACMEQHGWPDWSKYPAPESEWRGPAQGGTVFPRPLGVVA